MASKHPLDLRLQEFGKWRVVRKGQDTAHGRFWVCHCACSLETVELHEDALVEGRTKSCGCDYVDLGGRRRPQVDYVGRQMGNRLVLSQLPERSASLKKLYRCRCLCGDMSDVISQELAQRKSLQCRSCAVRKPLAQRWHTHTLFAYGPMGIDAHGHLTQRVIIGDNKEEYVVPARNVRSGKDQGKRAVSVRKKMIENRGKVREWAAMFFAWRMEGKSYPWIARELDVSLGSLSQYMRRHAADFAAYKSLHESFGDAELIMDKSEVGQ